MAAYVPSLNSNSQQQQQNSLTQPNQNTFFTPNSSLNQHRSNPIDFHASSDNFDSSDNKNGNEASDANSSQSTSIKSESESNQKSTKSQEKEQQPQQDNQQNRGWFSSLFSKLNPFSSSKVVDLSQHDNGEMVWNGHRYVLKGHENYDEPQNLPPPPPKGLAPISKSKSSPFPVTEPQKTPPPPGGAAVSTASQPPPPMVGPPPTASGSISSPPIGAVAPVGRTRVSQRYVAYI